MAFPLRALMGELTYRTVEIPVGRIAPSRRAGPRKGRARISPIVPAARGQPLIYWRPIAVTGVFMLALVVTVATTTRSSQAASQTDIALAASMEPAAAEAASGPPAPPAESRSEVARAEPALLPPPPAKPPLPPAEPPLPPPVPDAPPSVNVVADAAVQPGVRQSPVSPSPVVPGSLTPKLLVELEERIKQQGALEVVATCRGDYGTAISFARNPTQAAKIAKSEDKLIFLLHVSGNFEDDGFT